MSIIKAQGLQLAIASTFGTAATMSAITNASEAVATLGTGHGVIVGDIIEVTSGWKRIDKMVVRAKTVATNDVTLEGINTSSVTDYPAGSGTGTVREVTAWTTVSQLKRDVQSGGGGFQFSDATTLDDVRTQQVPILAQGVQLTFNPFWDPSLAWFDIVKAAARAGSLYPYRITLSSGAKIYGNAYWGFSDEPTVVDGLLVASITLSASPDSKTYTS
ncbi:MAG: phage tail protein [Burkholderiales bacterium]|jgi:hypothetical protein|nr:phage tail protein [Burkholderiales bacterium]